MTSNIHGLLHVGQQIRDNEPIFTSWELPLERYLGIIKPGAKSKVYITVSLANETHKEELLNHVRFAHSHFRLEEIRGRGDRKLRPPEIGHQVENGWFLPGVSTVHLNRTNQQLQNMLLVQLRVLELPLHLPPSVTRYGRYQIQGGHLIGSTISQLPGRVNRASHYITYLLESDDEIICHYFGFVQFYFLLDPEGDLPARDDDDPLDPFEPGLHLAFVKNWRVQLELPTGYRFVRDSQWEVIDIRAIQASIGTVVSNGIRWILMDADLENNPAVIFNAVL